MGNFEYITGYFNKHKVTSSIRKQAILFLFAGGICFIADFSILVFFVEILKINVIIANCISVLVTILISYILNIKFIFQNGKYGFKKEVSLFFIFSGISFLLDVFFLYVLIEYLMLWYILAKIIDSLVVALFNFSTRKWFIFSK